jgi:chemotaxis protein CheX
MMMKEVVVDGFEVAIAEVQPVAGDIQDKLLEPFIAATRAALGEMAGTEVVVRAVFRQTLHPSPIPHSPMAKDRGRGEGADIAAVLELRTPPEGALVLRFPERTAAALARRILAGVSQEVDENLIRDCVAEIANVVAGQAKALLAGTAYRFAFSLPRVVVGAAEFRPQQGLDCLVVAFSSERGEFALQLFLKL